MVLLFFIYLLYKFFNSNSDNFTNDKLNQADLKVFNFNTKWCYWSKHFRPEWDKFMDSVKQIKMNNSNFNVVAIDVDCEDPKNNNLISQYEIPGYPYVLIESKNGQTIEYNKKRTSDELLNTVNEMLSNVSLK